MAGRAWQMWRLSRRRTLAAGLVSAVGAVALGLRPRGAAAQPQPARVASGAGGTFGVDDLPVAAADLLGYWSQAGLAVDWVPRRGGVAAMQAILDDEADVAYGGLGAAVAARARGEPLRIVCSMSLGLAQALVVNERIRTPADLRGARWAIDGFGALSHQFARQIVRALGIPEAEIRFEVKGPPPQRIAALTTDEVDAALIRVEEALALSRQRPDLPTLLGFDELERLVPLQAHGVIAATERTIADQPALVTAVVRGLLFSSRALHEQRGAFAQALDRALPEPLAPEDTTAIWTRLQRAGAFAVNGGMAPAYWARQIAEFDTMNPDLAGRTTPAALLEPTFVQTVLGQIGVYPADWDPAPAGG